MTQIIEILVSPSGKTQVATHGFSGASCRDASRFLEQALGSTLGEELSSEFYQTNDAASELHEGQA